MKKIIFLLIFLVLEAKYLDSKSCKECHEDIYYEHINSMHSKSSLFKDEFHRKMKEINFPKKYECAVCHTPGADNLDKIVSGDIQPSHTKKELDGVSCLYCHQIARIEKSHYQNKNIATFGRDGKQLVYGALDNPGDSDKHKSLTINKKYNIYANSKVCMGCHSHKRNKLNDVEVCKISIDETKQTDCIGCHMPKENGGVTKINKKGRLTYASHAFLGIRSEDMVKKAVELKVEKISNNKIKLIIKNKMGHQILLQPMRLKYVELKLIRNGKVIWKNFKNSPYEDKEVTFSKLFLDKNNNRVYPPKAYKIGYYNNLDTYKSKEVIYNIPTLKKGDKIVATWISYPIRPSLAKELDIDDYDLTKKYIGFKYELNIK